MISLQGFNNGQFFSDLALQTTAVSLGSHATGALAGMDVDKYGGAVLIDEGFNRFSLLAASVLIGIRSAMNDVGIGTWKHIGRSQSGLFAGNPTARGAFVVGVPTADDAISSIASSAYSGYAYGGIEFEGVSLTSFDEFSAQGSVNYDAGTGQITVTLNNFSRYTGDIIYDVNSPQSTHISSAWPNGQPLSMETPLSCTAEVFPSTNTFSCNLANSNGNVNGTFTGRFYGLAGREIGGSFAVTGLIGGGGFDNGIAGAVALKSQ